MTEVRNRVVQNLGLADAEDEEELTTVNGQRLQPGNHAKNAGGWCEGTPAIVNQEDVAQVEDAIGRTGGAANHPDGPGVGGD